MMKTMNRTFASSYKDFLTEKIFIDGKWKNSANGKTFAVHDPSTGQVLHHASDCGEDDIVDAIEAAHKSFKTWKNTMAKERSALLRRLFELQMENADHLAYLISMEMGKTVKEAKTEISYGASFFEWFAEEAKRVNGEVFPSPFPNSMTMYLREPIGPVGIITPWNFPNAMITRKLAAALAAGCTAVIKPAEDSPFSALALAQLVEEAGFPAGVVNVVTCSRASASGIGSVMCKSHKLSALSFTGSTAVGKILLSEGSSTVKKIFLELGGNAPLIVFKSADINTAVQGCINAKFRNCGQACIAANRIYVDSSIHDEFVAKLALKMSQELKVGNSTDPGSTVGPMVNAKAVEKMKAHVKDAVDKGGKIKIGGKVIDGNFFEPTLIVDVKANSLLCSEETFGPLAAVIKFDNEQNVIDIANSTRFGLAGYFFSNDYAQVWRVAKKLEMGMIGINQGAISCAECPFGGIKESGIGREGSKLGIEEFTNVKYLCMGAIPPNA